MPAATTTTAAPITSDTWVDRKQAADLAGCSVDTIRRDEKEHHLATREVIGGTVQLRIGDLTAIGRISAAALDPAITAQQAAEATRLRRELAALQADNARLRAANAELTGRLARSREERATLTAQPDAPRALIALMGDLRGLEAVR
jgi:hypothetical protein